MNLLVLRGAEGRTVLIVEPIATHNIQPTMLFIEIKNLFPVGYSQPLQLPFHGEIGQHIVKATNGASIRH